MDKKYSYNKSNNIYTVKHTESNGDETEIAYTNTAEKADVIVIALNYLQTQLYIKGYDNESEIATENRNAQ